MVAFFEGGSKSDVSSISATDVEENAVWERVDGNSTFDNHFRGIGPMM